MLLAFTLFLSFECWQSSLPLNCFSYFTALTLAAWNKKLHVTLKMFLAHHGQYTYHRLGVSLQFFVYREHIGFLKGPDAVRW